MDTFSKKLKEKGIMVDVICSDDYYVTRNTETKWSFFTTLMLRLCKQPSVVGKVSRKIFFEFFIYLIIIQYDLIDFHAFVDSDIRLAKFCKSRGIEYDITIWGSDLLRADNLRIERMKDGFDGSRYIKATESLHDVLAEKYSGRYEAKKQVTYFGNSGYDEIDKLSSKDIALHKHKMYGDTKQKLIVVCGYNGIKFQNHKLMIQSFQSLSEKYKKNLYLVFPMTYGAPKEYICEIRNLLERSGYSYTVFDKFLSNEEVAVIRKTADFVVNIQNTDAFAGSIQDHLYCEQVLLIGEWLQYTALDKANVFYLKTSLDELTMKIDTTLSNLDTYKKMCHGNKEKMQILTSWGSVIDNWSDIYGE